MFAQRYAKYYDSFYRDKPYKKEINFVYKWAGKPMSIFDIGCGTAKYWIYYPPGTRLMGIDSSLDMVNRAQDKRITCAGAENYSLVGYEKFDCATALFNVINYISRHDWWKNIPLKKGSYFIFDILDRKKVNKEGFKQTIKAIDGILRIITPLGPNKKEVKLNVTIAGRDIEDTELHKMYVYSESDIKRFCGRQFEIVDKKGTKTWQTWYKLRRK